MDNFNTLCYFYSPCRLQSYLARSTTALISAARLVRRFLEETAEPQELSYIKTTACTFQELKQQQQRHCSYGTAELLALTCQRLAQAQYLQVGRVEVRV